MSRVPDTGGRGAVSVYRFQTESDLRGTDGVPSFQLAEHFHYDRDELGTATLPKLAQEAVRKLGLDEDAELLDWWARTADGGRRVWVWRNDGEFIGSIVVVVEFEPRCYSLGHTIQRAVACP